MALIAAENRRDTYWQHISQPHQREYPARNTCRPSPTHTSDGLIMTHYEAVSHNAKIALTVVLMAFLVGDSIHCSFALWLITCSRRHTHFNICLRATVLRCGHAHFISPSDVSAHQLKYWSPTLRFPLFHHSRDYKEAGQEQRHL